jgi:hypothetical protein
METLQILGWIYLGVMLGSIGGVMGLGLFIGPKMKQYIREIDDLEEEKRLLKAQLDKSYKRGKPQPRKKRTWKRKPTKK